MKRIIAILLLSLTAFGALAQSRSEPQIAYRILGDYIVKKQSQADDRLWAGIMLGTGGVFLAGGAASWFLGDTISQAVAPGNTGWTEENKFRVSIVLGGIGAASSAVGLIGMIAPSEDWKKKFQLIYDEKDPVVQEALSVASLKELADSGRDRRITSAAVNIATPLAVLLLQTILNVSTGKSWYQGYESVGSWQIPAIVAAATTIATPSSEERLYEKYMSARAAIYAAQ
jgi:hypothetical protein